MPLPRSALPMNVSRSFATLGDEGGMTRAQELYFKHHPAVYQKALYERLLASEQFKAQTDAQKQQLLQKQLADLNGLLARYRETGAGPSGSAKLATGFGASGRAGGGRGGGGAGGAGGVTGDYLDFVDGMTGNEINRGRAGLDAQLLVEKEMERIERKPVQFAAFEQQFLAEEDRLNRQGRVTAVDLAAKLIADFTANAERLAGDLERATPYQSKRAAADFYMQLRKRFPSLLGAPGQPITPDAMAVLDTIDEMYGTEGFILNTLMTGEEPLFKVEQERQRVYRDMQQAAGVPVQPFEQRGRQLLGSMSVAEQDTNKDGRVSEDEKANAMKRATEQARKELGIAEPLTDEEALLVSRYTGLLEDDGVISDTEKTAFGPDFDAARAAFEKGRRVENLPRGVQPFYDQTYLDLLEERAGLRSQLGQLGAEEGTPQQRAARATLGLPTIDPAALAQASAAAGTPLAGETMPFAVARYNKAGGQINPESPAERVAQRIIDANQGAIPFLDFVAAVNKRYPKDELARRDALAYYGAYGYSKASIMETLDMAKAASAIGEQKKPKPAPAPAAAAPKRAPPSPSAPGPLAPVAPLTTVPPAVAPAVTPVSEGGRGVGGSSKDLPTFRPMDAGQGVDASINLFGAPPSPPPGVMAVPPMGSVMDNMPLPFGPSASLGPSSSPRRVVLDDQQLRPTRLQSELDAMYTRSPLAGVMAANAMAPLTFTEPRLPVSAAGSSLSRQVGSALGPMPPTQRQLSEEEVRELERELLIRDLLEEQRRLNEARGNVPR